MNGVWEGKLDFPSGNDSISLVLTQDGSTVKGFGFLRAPASGTGSTGVYYYGNPFGVGGTVSARTMELAMAFGPQSRLNGLSTGNEVAGVIDINGYEKLAVSLRRSRPASAGVAGTWALTGGSPYASADTIIVAPDGRVWEHREGSLLGSARFVSTAMWKRSGDWVVIHHYLLALTSTGTDSLRLTSGELQRPYNSTTTERFTRISREAVFP